MSKIDTSPDAEFAAMQTIYSLLEPLEPDSRQRVLKYVAARLQISTSLSSQDNLLPSSASGVARGVALGTEPQREFGTLAELFDAAQPQRTSERALVAGFWVQVCEGTGNFSGFAVNKELKELGHGIANITSAINALKNQSPALVLQIKKGGTSRQARKTYKITAAGIKHVEMMLNG